MSKPYDLNTTYLMVLRLTANASGIDTIDVYVAAEGAETIDFRRTIEVETFSAANDLSNLKIRIVRNDYSDARLWWVDEVRLATTAGALGIDPSLLVVPPPEGTLLMVQ
jgi:hypothetical protein